MAIAFVRQAIGTTSSATTLVATITAPAAGNALIAVFSTNGTSTPTGISGGGVTWALLKEQDASVSRNIAIWYGLNSTGVGTSVTITWASKVHSGANISEWSGITAIDLTAGAAGTSTTIDAGAVSATLDDSLVIAGGNNGANGSAPSAGPTNSFNALTGSDQNDDADMVCAYRITTAAGSYSTAWTVTSVEWAAAIATFQGTAAAGGHPTMRRWGGVPGMGQCHGSGRSW